MSGRQLDQERPELARVTPAQRQQQLAARAASYAWRLAEEETG
jgi:hypothetical protein